MKGRTEGGRDGRTDGIMDGGVEGGRDRWRAEGPKGVGEEGQVETSLRLREVP